MDYKSALLDEQMVPDNPLDLFKIWMSEAIKRKVPEPTAMALCTSTKEGKPSSRMVLLKEVTKLGFVFFTNYESRKGIELIQNPFAALTFYWSTIAKQVRIEGRIKKVSRSESRNYFASRPRKSQIGAWTSHQSTVISSRNELDEWFRFYQEKFKDKKIPCPEFWGGFLLIPQQIEFWQGRESRLHDRILFLRTSRRWEISRLSP